MSGVSTAPRRSLPLALLAAVAALGGLALVAGYLIGGAAEPTQVLDAGEVVRWALPMSKYLGHFAMAMTIGALVLAAFALPERENGAALARLQQFAAGSAAIWTASAVATLLLSYLSASGSNISIDQDFSASLWFFVTNLELGIALGVQVVLAAAVSLLALSARGLAATAVSAAVALAATLPLALTGHSSGAENHSLAVNSMLLHLVGISIWLGGLVALFAVRNQLERAATLPVLRRYSSLALMAFALIGLSGMVSAWVRVDEPSQLLSGYGGLLLAKVFSFVILGGFGAWHRLGQFARLEREIAADEGPRSTSWFWRVLALELGIMTVVLGLATALARTPLPLSEKEPLPLTPARILTGELLPPEFTAASLLTEWKPDLLWLVVVAAMIGGYLMGVRRLHLRGDRWPIGRTVSWVAGSLLLGYITNGAMNAYQEYLFSIHMVAHMLLTMAVPVLLVPGAPVTMIARAVKARQDGSRGIREWVLWAVHTRYARFVSHPVVAAVLFASSLIVFYFTPLFAWATSEHLGHQWMTVHFVITGYLFVQSLVGIDPGPNRLGYPFRLVTLIGTMAFHAFFGLAIMEGNGLLLADWYGAMGREWGASPLEDQRTGGAIAWGIGELPTAALTLLVSIQWARADKRESIRLDRAADRSGGAELQEYNRMLETLAKRKQVERR